MMSKKNFDDIANVLHGEKPHWYDYMEEMEAIRMNAKQDMWDYMQGSFIYLFKDNKNFDETRFKEVCANGVHV